jgi:hypothetical protein
MPKIARAHHYVPQFLLAGFTPSGSKEDVLWASDRQTGRQWHTTPENVAVRKDFYRIEVSGIAPDVIEAGLSTMEGHAAPVICDILRTRAIPHGDDYMTLMNFMALMSVRVPSGRDMVNHGVDFISKQLLKAALQTPETWKAELQEARAAGIDIDEETASHESMTESLEKGKYTFTVDQNWQIKTMLELMGKLAPCLAPRKWCLAISDSGSFICSDRPVTVRFTRQKAAIDSPGFMREDTEITFPLSRNVLLIGSWEPMKTATITLTRKNIALYNGFTAHHCQRFLFSTAKDFCWLDKESKVRYDFGPLAKPLNNQQ